MTEVAIIGGTGLRSLKNLEIERRQVMHTPYGEPSGPFTHGELCGKRVVFLARHGTGHTIPPHKVNYRANLWALQEIGVEQVIAVAAVGGICAEMAPARLAVPDQIVDYTHSRKHTYFEGDLSQVTHIEFTEPYCQALRQKIIGAAGSAGIDVMDKGTYGATQGPRLETAMEINKLERDGCDMVGMTGMPEAALARELGLCYATIAVTANRAAGRGAGVISMDAIDQNLKQGMTSVRAVLERVIPQV